MLRLNWAMEVTYRVWRRLLPTTSRGRNSFLTLLLWLRRSGGLVIWVSLLHIAWLMPSCTLMASIMEFRHSLCRCGTRKPICHCRGYRSATLDLSMATIPRIMVSWEWTTFAFLVSRCSCDLPKSLSRESLSRPRMRRLVMQPWCRCAHSS